MMEFAKETINIEAMQKQLHRFRSDIVIERVALALVMIAAPITTGLSTLLPWQRILNSLTSNHLAMGLAAISITVVAILTVIAFRQLSHLQLEKSLFEMEQQLVSFKMQQLRQRLLENDHRRETQ